MDESDGDFVFWRDRDEFFAGLLATDGGIDHAARAAEAMLRAMDPKNASRIYQKCSLRIKETNGGMSGGDVFLPSLVLSVMVAWRRASREADQISTDH